MEKMSTATTIAYLNKSKCNSVPVSLPPLPEQKRIVAEVERRLSVVDAVEALVEANLRRAERLRQAFLKRAFEGRLAPQDPEDEPADVLLERIRTQREGRVFSRSRGKARQVRLPGI